MTEPVKPSSFDGQTAVPHYTADHASSGVPEERFERPKPVGEQHGGVLIPRHPATTMISDVSDYPKSAATPIAFSANSSQKIAGKVPQYTNDGCSTIGTPKHDVPRLSQRPQARNPTDPGNSENDRCQFGRAFSEGKQASAAPGNTLTQKQPSGVTRGTSASVGSTNHSPDAIFDVTQSSIYAASLSKEGGRGEGG